MGVAPNMLLQRALKKQPYHSICKVAASFIINDK